MRTFAKKFKSFDHSIFEFSVFMAICENCTVADQSTIAVASRQHKPRTHFHFPTYVSTLLFSNFLLLYSFVLICPPFCVNSLLVKYISSLFRAAVCLIAPLFFVLFAFLWSVECIAAMRSPLPPQPLPFFSAQLHVNNWKRQNFASENRRKIKATNWTITTKRLLDRARFENVDIASSWRWWCWCCCHCRRRWQVSASFSLQITNLVDVVDFLFNFCCAGVFSVSLSLSAFVLIFKWFECALHDDDENKLNKFSSMHTMHHIHIVGYTFSPCSLNHSYTQYKN